MNFIGLDTPSGGNVVPSSARRSQVCDFTLRIQSSFVSFASCAVVLLSEIQVELAP